jgi:hypothetical protein
MFRAGCTIRLLPFVIKVALSSKVALFLPQVSEQFTAIVLGELRLQTTLSHYLHQMVLALRKVSRRAVSIPRS